MSSSCREDALLMLCNDESQLMKSIASMVVAQHANEGTIVREVAGHAGEKSIIKGYQKSLKTEVVGTTQTLMVFAEVYRLMVNKGMIEPVDALALCSYLHITPSDVDEMISLCEKSLERDNLGGLLDDPILTIKGMNKNAREDSDEDEEKVMKDLADSLSRAFGDARKAYDVIKEEDKKKKKEDK